jgi:ribosomal protein S27E
MSENRIEVTCIRCGHKWYIDLDDLDQLQQVIYRGEVVRKQYRVRCPQCDTYNVITVEFEEGGDG